MTCAVCPKQCKIDRFNGEIGYCGETADLRIAKTMLHHWEEPVLCGNVGSGAVFFSGCPLNCIYCQNHSISHEHRGKVYSIDELSSEFMSLQKSGALNINLVSPTHFAPQIRAAIFRSRASGLTVPIVWNTSGYESVRAIEDNEGFADVYLSDFKYYDNSLAKAYSGIDDYREVALEALKCMVDSVGEPRFDLYHDQRRMTSGVIVRHMIIPGHIDDSKAVLKTLHDEFGGSIMVSIMNQYTPILSTLSESGNARAKKLIESFPNLGLTLTDDEYEEVLDFADEMGLEDYFWQSGETCSESFIPEFDNI